ncbi:Hsp20/alpha crystallin family protein [Kutzneria viridogrisea]|uniref:SHSP domain-containing protein n=2 Tax=Kutzneria TaxID=43356 RepID=W5W781_9PSEU|nr:Hsp20/alpha crystallin family protein [Kutzneria albida]AHH97018.1 hypothetical protein KALB_3654 [Kutzneria albida DSM 43870]MBA8932015.1 HSP20 family protein [Kutzneria viridogrisea]
MAQHLVRPHSPFGSWDPLHELEDLYGQLGRWMDSFTDRGEDISQTAWSPLADVTETAEDYLIEIDLPGVRREDVTIDLAGSELTVSGMLEQAERRGAHRRRARRTGRFLYRVSLPQDLAADKIDAKLRDGVLTIRVPKSEVAKPHRIAISAK